MVIGRAPRSRRVSRWLTGQLYRIRTRLLLVNALIVAVPLLGVGFARFYEREMLGAVEADMVHQSQVVAELLGRGAVAESATLRAAAHQTTTRLRVVSISGHVIADSAGMEGAFVGERVEIERALAGRYGAATRVVPNRAVSVMFTAVPVVRDRTVIAVIYASRSTVSVQVAMRRLRASIFEVLRYALGATAILTFFFAATVSRPLGVLARRARRLAAGDRTVALSLQRKDEIGELARALDEMATELDRRAGDVAALAANLSHELKSPLTSMRGAAELLLEGAAADPIARERFLGNIVSDVDRLDRLVSRMLELSRAHADVEEFARLDLCSLVGEAIRAAETRGTVELRRPARAAFVLARAGHLTSAIRNLVDNAIAHAAPGSAVMVTIRATRRLVTVDVANQGAPIGAAAQSRLFERFFTTRAESGGTGLGLPIVRAVARAHGGEIRLVASDAASTVFSLSLPRV